MFQGSCHCGKVAFTVDDALPTEALECNCSHCRRKGFLLAFYPPEKFTLERGEGAVTSYFFNKHAIDHQFCTTCGVQPCATGKGPDGKVMHSVNLRCVDGLDPDTLKINQYNGAAT